MEKELAISNTINSVIIEEFAEKPLYDKMKRMIDLILCLIAAPIGGILVFIAAILIKIESKGPIIYAQERLGKNNKEFKLYKLRSMGVDAEKNGAQWAQRNDPRVTRVGKFIRKTRIDEIPQLWNIFLGDMSIVGPRPEREIFYNKFEDEGIPFRARLKIKPGLTGLAQVNGGYEIGPDEKLRWDIEYIRERSIIKDIKIIFKTVAVVFTGHGAR